MGFNTVALLLNDAMHETVKSPQTLAWGLCHPPHSSRDLELGSWMQQVRSISQERGERDPFLGGVHVLPTFHADDVNFLYAGRNHIERLEFCRFGVSRADKVPRHTVTLYLPNWLKK